MLHSKIPYRLKTHIKEMYTFTEIEVCTNDKPRTGVKLQTSLTLPIDLVKRTT